MLICSPISGGGRVSQFGAFNPSYRLIVHATGNTTLLWLECTVVAQRIARLMRARIKTSDMAVLVGGAQGWRFVARPGAFVPHAMRKWVNDGWLYRDPTEDEIKDFLVNEAW